MGMHKRVHSMKLQSVVIPNGLIANLAGPFEGKRHDATMLYQSVLLPSCSSMLFMMAPHFVFMVTLNNPLEFIFKVHSKIANSHLKCKTTIGQ